MAGRYTGRLTNSDVLKLLRKKRYVVDLAAGIVLNRNSNPVAVVERESHSATYQFVELYDGEKRRKISVASLVWMAGTNHTVPRKFVVHHRDFDTLNNAFDNLYCLHDVDHRKLHNSEDLVDYRDDEVPF